MSLPLAMAMPPIIPTSEAVAASTDSRRCTGTKYWYRVPMVPAASPPIIAPL
jgi:hypothetical protein